MLHLRPGIKSGLRMLICSAALITAAGGVGTIFAKPPVFQEPASGADSRVTFNRDIAPIIFRSCSSCHHPGEAGPFSLLTYSDVKKHARQIVDVTKARS